MLLRIFFSRFHIKITGVKAQKELHQAVNLSATCCFPRALGIEDHADDDKAENDAKKKMMRKRVKRRNRVVDGKDIRCGGRKRGRWSSS